MHSDKKLQSWTKILRKIDVVMLSFKIKLLIACVASVSVRFRSKERGTGVKDRATNGKRTGRGWERKEGNACRQTQGF